MTSRFLPSGASVSRRIQAAADNHTAWFSGEMRQANGAIWKDNAPEEIAIAFPQLTPETAGETLDEIIGEGRKRDVKSIACWSLSPSKPRDLGAKLAARGFEWGWQPHWMSLDLDALGDEKNLPNGLQIAVDDAADWNVEDLPYYAPGASKPGAIHFGAWLDGQIAGHCVVFLTHGERGIAGIYNVGVVPALRRRGVGRAVTLAACRMARDLGAHYALLNAAAPELYSQCGFVSLGFGQTWWMHAPTLAAPPPSAAEVAFAEALGRGDVKFLDSLTDIPADLDALLASQFSPLTLAIRAEKSASVRWLMRHGASLSARSGARQTTPLHDVVMNGDVKMLRLLLSFRPDRQILEARDAEYHGTPLSWARHLEETECAEILETYAASLG